MDQYISCPIDDQTNEKITTSSYGKFFLFESLLINFYLKWMQLIFGEFLSSTFSMAWARLFSTFCILARSPTSDSKARNRLQISMDFSGGTCPEDRTRSYRTRVLLSSERKSFHMCSMHEHCVLHKVQYCVNVYFLTLLNAGLNLDINKKFLLIL